MLIAEGGGIRVHTIDGGTVWLDGGAMFGVVPKPLWSRHIEPDERNRIPLAMRCLLIETPDTRVLVDTGVGEVEDEKFARIHRIQNAGDPTRLHDSLRRAGVDASDIDLVVSTHLHFDHAGGNTVREGGELRPAFPNARYLIRRGEWEEAHSRNIRIRAAYLPDNFDPLEAHGVLELTEGDREIAPGVRLVGLPGHTTHHQGVLVELGDETLLYPADLVPTSAHARLPWIMAYDLEPLVTLSEKERWLGRAGEEGWLLVFEHDPEVALARARPATRGPGCELEGPVDDTDRRTWKKEHHDR